MKDSDISQRMQTNSQEVHENLIPKGTKIFRIFGSQLNSDMINYPLTPVRRTVIKKLKTLLAEVWGNNP